MKYKNKLNLHYWLRKIFTTRIFQLLPINETIIKRLVFNSIYKSKHWVQNSSNLPNEFVSISGHGSNINTTQHAMLVENFIKVIEKFKIKSILDIPCGDFLWIKNIIAQKNLRYLGVDIVSSLIEQNNYRYKSKNIDFETCDIINFVPNKNFDLLIIRDLFLHVTNSDIKKILNQIKTLDIKYVALNSYNNLENEDVVIGKHRKINLLIKPFNLKKPILQFKDYENDKFFYIYEKASFG